MPNLKHFNTVEEYRDYYRDYRAKNREKLRIYNLYYNRQWRAKFGSEHDKVRSLVWAKIQSGELVKLPCTVCGEKDSQAHHEDYSKPLEVLWLCTVHHKEKHTSTTGRYPHHFTDRGGKIKV